MNKELENKLYDRFPDIFVQKDWDKRETCMCWGIECGDGWYKNIEWACNKWEEIIKLFPGVKIQLTQVKEKYGGLRLYHEITYPEGLDDKVGSLIHNYSFLIEQYAESCSKQTCETCGHPGTLGRSGGWWSTLCDQCREGL